MFIENKRQLSHQVLESVLLLVNSVFVYHCKKNMTNYSDDFVFDTVFNEFDIPCSREENAV